MRSAARRAVFRSQDEAIFAQVLAFIHDAAELDMRYSY